MTQAVIPIYGTLRSATVNGALIEDFGIVGGYHAVNTIAERDAIKSSLRVAGMAVYVTATEMMYILKSDLESWTEHAAGSGNYEAYVPCTLVTKNTIDIVRPTLETTFEKSMAVYIDDITEYGSIIKTFGFVIPTNMPANPQFGAHVYMKEDKTLTTTLDSDGKYKFVGVIVIDDKGQYAIALSNTQTTYKVISDGSVSVA